MPKLPKIHLLPIILLLIVFASAAAYFLLPKAMRTTTKVSSKKVIKLAYNPWIASELNAKIAKILLEEKLGYTVELTSIGEFEEWTPIAKGQLHATLEVWPSGHPDEEKKYIQQEKSIENGGPLGPIGKMGWYIPDYLLAEHPELATWEGYKDPKNTKIFITPESDGKGQFTAGDPSWVQYDQDIIKNLGLSLNVVRLDSEEKVLNALDTAYKKKQPILLYLWTPHWAHAVYDLVPVELPPYSDACYKKAKSGGVDCDYASDKLYKIFWSGFRSYAPTAYEFLKKFNYTTSDQISLMAMVQIDRKTTDEAARIWIDQHEDIWKTWIP